MAELKKDAESVPGLDKLEAIESEILSRHDIKTRYYPGDLVSYKVQRPFDLSPCYGIVIAPNNPFIRHTDPGKPEIHELNKRIGPTPTTRMEITQGPIVPTRWNYDTGIQEKLPVQWTESNRIAVVPEKKVSIIDRPVTTGQLVKNYEENIGVVTGVASRVTLQILNTNHVIENVPVEVLNPISPYVRGREILYKGWIGVILAVKRQTTCRLDGGGVFTLTTNESDGFLKPDPYWAPGTPVPSARNKYPSSVMKKAKFESKTRQFFHRFVPPVSYFYSSANSTIIGVEALSIDVKWLQKCPTSSNSIPIEPPITLDKKCFNSIKALGIPSYDTLGMNSIRMYKYRPNDPVISYGNWIRKFRTQYFNITESNESETTVPDKTKSSSFLAVKQSGLLTDTEFEVPVKVIFRQTIAEILWNDGTRQRIPSTKIPFLVSPEFNADKGYPSGLVVKPIFDDESGKYGVVQENLLSGVEKNKILSVRWILPSEQGTKDLGLKDESIYDIEPHPKISVYQKGTLVFIRDNSNLYEAGTVYNIDVARGQVLVTVPEDKNPIYLWPHQLLPMTKKCYWDFFYRVWKIDDLLPPLHQNLLEEGIGCPKSECEPIALSNPNNNPEIEVGTIWDLPIFDVLTYAPTVHKYYEFPPVNPRVEWASFVGHEISKLKANLPEGVWIRGYENRIDLFSMAILGPEKTCYADGLFFFDIQIPIDFPIKPPKVHYVPYTFNPVSPYLAHDGTFCISKLNMEFTEKPESYISAVILQIQELIFSPEPYLRFHGKEINTENLKTREESRSFNERVLLDVLTSCYNMALKPYEPWKNLIEQHFASMIPIKINTVKNWMQDYEKKFNENDSVGFELFPLSAGFYVAIESRLKKFEEILTFIPSSDTNNLTPMKETNGNMENKNPREEPGESDFKACVSNAGIKKAKDEPFLENQNLNESNDTKSE